MKIFVPDYYKKFKCIADKCTDSCCVGWAIEIDDETLEKYKKVEEPFGGELMSSLDISGRASFKCDDAGRCANLDERGLCKIITTLGEGYLCQICRDHPRYFNCAHGRCEGGLGLACEVAADLILSIEKLPEIVEEESDELVYLTDEESPFSFSARDYLLSELFDDSLEISSRIGRLLNLSFRADELLFDILCGTVDENTPAEELLSDAPDMPFDFYGFISESLSIFYDLEMLTPDYTEKMQSATANAKDNIADFVELLYRDGRIPFRNLTYYFIHRYLLSTDGSLRDNMQLALSMSLAAMALVFLSGDTSRASLIAETKEFSKNIEYSTENVETLLLRIENL